MRYVQELVEHKSSGRTGSYTHVNTRNPVVIKSPLYNSLNKRGQNMAQSQNVRGRVVHKEMYMRHCCLYSKIGKIGDTVVHEKVSRNGGLIWQCSIQY